MFISIILTVNYNLELKNINLDKYSYTILLMFSFCVTVFWSMAVRNRSRSPSIVQKVNLWMNCRRCWYICRSWESYCGKVAGSIPDLVIGVFYW